MKILIREQGKKDGGVYHFMTAIKKTDTGKYFSKKIFVRFAKCQPVVGNITIKDAFFSFDTSDFEQNCKIVGTEQYADVITKSTIYTLVIMNYEKTQEDIDKDAEFKNKGGLLSLTYKEYVPKQKVQTNYTTQNNSKNIKLDDISSVQSSSKTEQKQIIEYGTEMTNNFELPF